MIRIYTRTGIHDVPDTLLSLLGQIVAQSNSVTDVEKIDETEATPVLEDVPEDPEVTIERLNARILELEAELEERRRATDAVIEALRPLGTILQVEQAPEVVQTVTGAHKGVDGNSYTAAQAGASRYLRGQDLKLARQALRGNS